MSQTAIPFIDLSRIHNPLMAEFKCRADDIITRSAFILGKEVGDFERAFARYIGTEECVGVASGLDALKLVLMAAGIGPGDEVLVPANTFIATAFAVSSVGARPVFVDIESDTCNMDPKKAEQALTPKTKAILPVHLYGQAATMEPLLQMADHKNLYVFEDCAQAHGAYSGQKRVGSLGHAGCFSFYPTKNLGALGDGGAVCTNDDHLAANIRMLANVAQKEKNVHLTIGMNSRLDTLQAAWLQAKLPQLDRHNQMRIQAASFYEKHLADVPSLQRPQVRSDRNHVYHLYVVRTRTPEERSALQNHLNERNIGNAVHYPTPIHMQPCYRSFGQKEGSFPESERLAKTALSLPMFPGMTENEVATVTEAVHAFYKSARVRTTA